MPERKLISMFLLCALLAPLAAWADDAPENLYSFGPGPVEIYIFSDYFCPPCQKVEPILEVSIKELHRLGVKIIFVDKPLQKMSTLFSRYFLYAARAAESFEEILRARAVLFDIAKAGAVDSERSLSQQLRENHVERGLVNVRPVFDRWTALIGRFGVNSTPTVIVLRPGRPEERHAGSLRIPEAMDLLLKELSPGA